MQTSKGKILEVNIIDGAILARIAANESISGTWTFMNNIVLTAGTDIRPSSNSTTAISIAQADGTDFVIFDTINKNVGIGTSPTSTDKLIINQTSSGASITGLTINKSGLNTSGTSYGLYCLGNAGSGGTSIAGYFSHGTGTGTKYAICTGAFYSGFNTLSPTRMVEIQISSAEVYPLSLYRTTSSNGSWLGLEYALLNASSARKAYAVTVGGIVSNTAGAEIGFFSVKLLKSGTLTGDFFKIRGDTGYSIFTDNTSDVPATKVELAETKTLTGALDDGYSAALTLDPEYSGAYTVTRHNYLDINNPGVTGSTIIDACVMRFDANAGTHKALDSGTTKVTMTTVDAWVKINVNGTIHYIPAYTSKTS